VSHVFLSNFGHSAQNANLVDIFSVNFADVIWTGNTIFDHFHCDWHKDFELFTGSLVSLSLVATESAEVTTLGKTTAIVVFSLEKSSGIVGEL
jgi:hypothetical protein